MSTGENEKPLAVKNPTIVFLHFGSAVGDGTSLQVADSPEASGGRQVDLYAIRAKMAFGPSKPAEDSLPCRFFQIGAQKIPGAPGIDVPSPVHHKFKTRWVGANIVFPVVYYENIYHQAPVWTLSPPAGRENHYADRFYEVTVTNPASVSCSASAARR
jgi:hypothetical protein